MKTFSIWLVILGLAYSLQTYFPPKPASEPLLSQDGSAVEEQFNKLSDDDQSVIVDRWHEQNDPDPRDYCDEPDYP